MAQFSRLSTRAISITAVLAGLLICIHLSGLSPLPRLQQPLRVNGWSSKHTGSTSENSPQCRHLPRADDVVVVMRTGATEIKDKLSVHLNTTLRCYPNALIFSDYAEDFHGHQVHDVLINVADDIKAVNADFGHYRRIQEIGREGLDDSELSDSSYESGPIGKNDNAGWRLDKWKFLPMMERTLELQPDKKWYVFIEPDTYLVWSNLLQWLPKLDPSKPFYAGSEVQIGTDIFAHGGSAFIMSRPAVKMAAHEYKTSPDKWHNKTANHWAGDCILGQALKSAGVSLTWTWPMFQGGNPADLKWSEAKIDHVKLLWCSPALSYHHINPDEVQTLWEFEQRWVQNTSIATKSTSFLRQRPQHILYHSNTFLDYVLPNITAPRDNWTNLSPELIPNSKGLSLDDCRIICETKTAHSNETCVQYEVGPEGCAISSEVRMGRAQRGSQSVWLMDRVQYWMDHLEACGPRQGWIAP